MGVTPKRNPWTRWYAWVGYITTTAIIIASVVLWLDVRQYEARHKRDFIASCQRVAVQMQLDISRRHCSCTWERLRDQYTIRAIADEVSAPRLSRQFARHFDEAFFDDCW